MAYSSGRSGTGGGVLKHGKGSNEELNEELYEVKISCTDPFVNGKSPDVHCIEEAWRVVCGILFSSGHSGRWGEGEFSDTEKGSNEF